jgi:DNA replication protein DnaC
MESKEIAESGLRLLGRLNAKDPSSPESLEQSPLDPEAEKKRVESLVSRIPGVLSCYGIPRRFIRGDLTGSLDQSYLEKGVCLTGKVGVGKTMSLCLLVRDWLISRAVAARGTIWGTATLDAWKFISFPEFVMRVQDSFKNKDADQTAYEMLSKIAETPYLIIDDLGAEKPTEYVRQATYFLINHREMNMLPTFITTNFSMDHLDENIDPRVSSRIAGMCEIIRMEGKDRRIER